MKKIAVFLCLLVGLACFASSSYSDWQAAGSGSKLAISQPVNEPYADDTYVSFKWKCDFDMPVRYVVFAFAREEDGKEFFIYFNNVNAMTYLVPNKWYEISIPLSALDCSMRREKLKVGDTISKANIWVANNEGNAIELQVKDFKFSTKDSAPIIEDEPPPIKLWPRTDPVAVVSGEQMMFVELPQLAINGEFTLKVEGKLKVLDSPMGGGQAMPKQEITRHPYEITYPEDGVSVLNFSSEDYSELAEVWVPLYVDIDQDVSNLTVTVISDDKTFLTRNFHTRVVELEPVTLKNVPLVAWYYTGLESEYVPAFVDSLSQVGINGFFSMDGEFIDDELQHDTVFDYASEQGLTTGVAFFISRFLEHNDIYDGALVEMLDAPDDKFKTLLKEYILYLTDNEKVDFVIFDAELGAIKANDVLVGDMSEYNLAKFNEYANATTPYTVDDLTTSARELWVRYNCDLSNRVAALAKEAVKELWADSEFLVYSGYENDYGKKRDLTRERYAVDWQSMASVGMDYAGAGYHGSMEELAHMDRVMAGRTKFMPAEAYLWNFHSNQTGNYLSHNLEMRLIQSYLNSGMHGLSIWQAHVLDASALEAVNGFAKFASNIEDFVNGDAERAPQGVIPEELKQNVYVLRKGNLKTMVILNPSNKSVTYNIDGIAEEIVLPPFSWCIK